MKARAFREADLRPILAERLELLREKYEYNHIEFAKAAGVGRTRIMLWRTLRAGPQVGGLYKIAKAFGVTIDWLLGGKATAPAAPLLTTRERRTLARLLQRAGE